RKTNIRWVRDPAKEVFNRKRIDEITGVFLHWQVSSLLLTGAFIGWSYYYWDMVFVINDKRYLMSAIIIHIIWLSTWLIISLPLISAWHSWQQLKMRAISMYLSQNSRSSNSPVAEDFIKTINELHPVGFWNAAASGIGVAISLLTPVLQALSNS
uniref:hypothetical protein n=1 Tax=Spirosoma sp. TaxID=1899569 RepID=UPI003B3B7B77